MVDPQILGNTPVFTGTRIPVDLLLAYSEAGDTLDDFLEGFPSVRREQAEAFLDLALTFPISGDPMRMPVDGNLDRRLKRHLHTAFLHTAVEVTTATERGCSAKKPATCAGRRKRSSTPSLRWTEVLRTSRTSAA